VAHAKGSVPGNMFDLMLNMKAGLGHQIHPFGQCAVRVRMSREFSIHYAIGKLGDSTLDGAMKGVFHNDEGAAWLEYTRRFD